MANGRDGTIWDWIINRISDSKELNEKEEESLKQANKRSERQVSKRGRRI